MPAFRGSDGPSRASFGTILFLALAGLSACSDQATAPETLQPLVASISGRYSVRFIDGNRLPVTVCAGEVKVRAGTLRLRPDHTFVGSVRYSSPPTAPAETYQETGSYFRQSGTNRITFTSATRSGTTWTGTVLADGSLRIRYPVCGETHQVKLIRSL